MRKISKKHKGFTLLEVIISMALIGILSIGVYNAYLMLIRHTKDGEIKQETALIGKKIVEEVKSGQRSSDNTKIYFDKDGNVITNESEAFYLAEITRNYKNTETGENITINNGEYKNRIFVGENRLSYTESDVKTDSLINESKKIIVYINDSGTAGNIKFYNDTSSEISIRDMNYVALDFKYYGIAESIVVEVENASKKQLNLYILNSIKKSDGDWNVDIDNKLGVLTECRRSDNDGKSGTLYDVKVTVSGKNSKGINEDKLFETGFVENVNTP